MEWCQKYAYTIIYNAPKLTGDYNVFACTLFMDPQVRLVGREMRMDTEPQQRSKGKAMSAGDRGVTLSQVATHCVRGHDIY